MRHFAVITDRHFCCRRKAETNRCVLLGIFRILDENRAWNFRLFYFIFFSELDLKIHCSDQRFDYKRLEFVTDPTFGLGFGHRRWTRTNFSDNDKGLLRLELSAIATKRQNAMLLLTFFTSFFSSVFLAVFVSSSSELSSSELSSDDDDDSFFFASSFFTSFFVSFCKQLINK